MKYLYFLVPLLFMLSCNSATTNDSNKPAASTPVKKAVAKNELDQIDTGKVIYADGSEESIPYWKDKDATILYLVRHAEKQKDSKNPDLTPEGRARAKKLSIVTRNANIDKVYQSGLKRTFQTALPSLQANGISSVMYETSKLSALSETFLNEEKGKRLLVVGHSNTTPVIMNYLLGKRVYDNIPENEYDNIYIVATKGVGDTKIIEVKF